MSHTGFNFSAASISTVICALLRSFWTRCLVAAGFAFATPHAPMALRWPLRILAVIAVVSAFFVFTAEIERAQAVFRNWFAPGWRKFSRWVSTRAAWLRGVELLAALALIALCLPPLGQIAGAMANVSLRTDEIGSVNAYTRRGPFIAATTYNAAKNHTFYSVVNSLTPGAGSLNPFRARFWSFVAVGLTLLLLVADFWRRRQYAEGAIAFALIALNMRYLETALEARGYGFLGLAGFVLLAAWRNFLTSHSQKWLFILLLATVLGVYTLPYFIVFSGSALLALYFIKPSLRVLKTGIWSALLILALYLPVIGSVIDVAADYAEDYDTKFDGLDTILQALRYCVPSVFVRLDEVHLLSAACIALGLPLILRRERTPSSRTLQAGMSLIFGFLVFCLFLGTPPIRITSFLGPPFAFIAATTIALLLRHSLLIPVRPILAIAMLAPFIIAALRSAPLQDFEPREKWIEAAKFMDTLFPPGTKVWMEKLRHKNLRSYLQNPSRVQFSRPPDEDAYRRGEEIVFDAHHNKTMPSIDPSSLPQPTLSIPFVVRSGTQKICWFDQPATFASAVPREGVSDEYEVVVPTTSRALLLFFETQPHVTRVRASNASPQKEQQEVAIPQSKILEEGQAVAIPIPPSTTLIRFSAPARPAVVRLFP